MASIILVLQSDHLGSTSKVATSTGALHSQQLYKAWGESRYASGILPTRYTYTGQYSYAGDFGLVFYGSRFYDPSLSHFVQPDSIIPDPYNPLDWNRYAYSYGNPVKYIDPDGHCPRPANGSGNVICVDLFIQSKTIVFGLGRGDNRGFDTNSAPEASRAYAYIYLDVSGNVIGSQVSVNQSCTVVGCFGPADELNDFSVSQESAGRDINITWNLLNGVSGELREHANEAYEQESSIGAMPLYSNIVLAGSYGLASINGEMTLSLGDGGKYQITSLDRDPYPSLEVYFYKNGDYQYTLGQYKERYGPFIGLSPIAPNQRISAR